MILGQLIQAGKQFCEYRSREFIPTSDFHHTFLAYNVLDKIEVKTFRSKEINTGHVISEWLVEQDSIAYISISRDFDNRQTEFPNPIGSSREKNLTITAATDTTLGQMNFLIRGSLENLPIKLIGNHEIRSHSNFLSKNHLKERSSDEGYSIENLEQFVIPQITGEPQLVG